MDLILFGFLIAGFFIGKRKGFLFSFVSLCSTALIIFLSYRFCGTIANVIDKPVGSWIEKLLQRNLNKNINGTFSSMNQLIVALSNYYGRLFGVIASFLLKNISFEGSLTAGEIIAPSFSFLICKVLGFALFYIVFSFAALILSKLLHKLIKKTNLGFFDTLTGGVVGMIKWFALFLILYAILSSLANFTLFSKLKVFIETGVISKKLYNFLIIKIISLFY